MIKNEEDVDDSMASTKSPIDLESSAWTSPPTKKLRTYDEYKTYLSPCKGRGQSPKHSTPCGPCSSLLFSGNSRAWSVESKLRSKADEKLVALSESKVNSMKELDSIILNKSVKDRDKKVMDTLQKFGWCIDVNDIAINKNLSVDSFYRAMLSFFPEIQELQITEKITKLR